MDLKKSANYLSRDKHKRDSLAIAAPRLRNQMGALLSHERAMPPHNITSVGRSRKPRSICTSEHHAMLNKKTRWNWCRFTNFKSCPLSRLSCWPAGTRKEIHGSSRCIPQLAGLSLDNFGLVSILNQHYRAIV